MGRPLRSAEAWRVRVSTGSGCGSRSSGLDGRAHLAGGDPQVAGRGRQAAVAEQQLDGADIRARIPANARRRRGEANAESSVCGCERRRRAF